MGDYYTASGSPANKSSLASSPVRSQFAAIQTAFEKIPDFTANANKLMKVNNSASGWELLSSQGFMSGQTHVVPLVREGTFTPGLSADSPGTMSLSVAHVQGQYWRLGKMVYIRGGIWGTLTTGTATGAAIITGLPFAGDDISTAPASPERNILDYVHVQVVTPTEAPGENAEGLSLKAHVDVGATTLAMFWNGVGTSSGLNISQLREGIEQAIRFSGWYTTDAA